VSEIKTNFPAILMRKKSRTV